MSKKDKYNSYKYFIYSMLEYFKNEEFKLEERNFGSIRQLLDDYMKIYNQIKSNTGDVHKLQRSIDALEDNIGFYLKNTNLSKHRFFRKDISKIESMIKNKDVDNTKFYFSISAFTKKLKNINMLDIWIDLLLKDFTYSFDDIDNLLDCYVSELLFEGYSLKYLEEFWLINFKNLKECYDESSILIEIEKFRNLSQVRNNRYDLLINLSLPQKIKEEIREFGSLNINNILYTEFTISNSEEIKVESIQSDFLKKPNKRVYLNTKIKAPDKYTAMYIAVNNIVNYFEVYKVVDTSINKNVKVALLEKEGYKEYNINDFIKYSRMLSHREKEDIIDFIDLRDYFRRNHIDSKSIDDIANTINILQKLNELTRDNRLLNCWNSIESITRFYKDSKSNIDVVNSIIPKVICMYILKQKMNCLWERLYPLINKEILVNEKLKACISKKDSKKYNKSQFATFLLCEETAKWLYENTESNIIINRKVAELNKLLKNPKALEDYVLFKEKCIINNINSIYRLRNNLVHNGGSVNVNMESYTDRLQYYLNCILGTLIHHMKRNPDLSISEVLYSIVNSYDEYISNINELKSKVQNLKGKKIEEAIIDYGIENIAFINYLYI